MILRSRSTNKRLSKLDLDTASNIDIIGRLSDIIHNEQKKPLEKQDLDLISECLDFIDELPIRECEYTQEHIEQGLAQLIARQEGGAERLPNSAKRRGKPVKIAAVILAATVALLASLNIVAISEGYSSACELISINFERFFHLVQGKEVYENEIIYTKGGEHIAYDSIEDLLSSENLDVIYPSALPEDIRLEKLSCHDTNDGISTFTFTFSNNNLTLSICDTYKTFEEDLNKYEKYSTPVTVFYIEKISDQSYAATAHLSGYEYQIYFNDRDTLITILDNMKGIE